MTSCRNGSRGDLGRWCCEWVADYGEEWPVALAVLAPKVMCLPFSTQTSTSVSAIPFSAEVAPASTQREVFGATVLQAIRYHQISLHV